MHKTHVLISFCIILLFQGCASSPNTPEAEVAPTPIENWVTAQMVTSQGTIELKLNATRAPATVANFVNYAKDGHFNGLIFHRVIPGFMIQGGGHTPDLLEKESKSPIKNEATNGLSNLRGTISMARTEVIDSATSQFFINLVDNTRLDHHSTAKYGYAVFGKVVNGMDIVDLIGNTTTVCPSKGSQTACIEDLPDEMRDVPKTPIIIQKVEILN